MNPPHELLIGSLYLLFGAILFVISIILSFKAKWKKRRIQLRIKVFAGLISLVISSYVIPRGFGKVTFFTQFRDTKNRLDGSSLTMLANRIQHGLSFAGILVLVEDIKNKDATNTESPIINAKLDLIANLINEDAIRHLIDLKLVKIIVFPVTQDYTYCLTELGRYLLKKELRYPLYPQEFCDMVLLRFYFADTYKKELAEEKKRFNKRHGVPWDTCWKIFEDQIRKVNLQAKEEMYEVFKSYYSDEKKHPFDDVMKNIVNPWQQEFLREKKKNIFIYRFLKHCSS